MVYPGGKNGSGIYQRIINLMPPHDRYVEAFLGSGAVMRLKRPAAVNIGIDRDPAAIEQCRDLMTAGDGAISCDQVEFITGDSFETFRNVAGDRRTLIYCDPPYMHETRSAKDLYRFEMTDDQHEELLAIATAAKCYVMISGYRCPLYDQTLADWQSIDYQTQTRRGLKTETLWFNFPEPTALHDYSFLGVGYRERERIKRKKLRWVARLEKLDKLERQAILAAISESIGFD